MNDMLLVLVCSSCEGASNVKWTYNGTKSLNETTAKLSIPPDRVMSSSGCYRCSCSIDEVPFAVKARSAGMFDKRHACLTHKSGHILTQPQAHQCQLSLVM